MSNLLALDTLGDVIVYELEKTFCHFFHKPCSECIDGVIDCLVVSSECGFSHLHQKCVSWIGKYFVRVWPTRSFACLSNKYLESCFESTTSQIAPDTVVDTILNCEKLLKTTPKVKWAEPVFDLIKKLMAYSCDFISSKYDLVVATNSFISLGRSKSWDISAVEEPFLSAINNLTPETACKSIVMLESILHSSESESAFGYGPYADNYVALVRKMSRHCERFIVQNVNLAIHAKSWPLLSVATQQRIKDSAVIVLEYEKPLAPRPQLSSAQMPPLRRKRDKDNLSTSSRSNSNEDFRTSHRSLETVKSRNSLTSDVHQSADSNYQSLNNLEDSLSHTVSNSRNASGRIRRKTGERTSQVAKVSPFSCRSVEKQETGGELTVSAQNSNQEVDSMDTECTKKIEQEKVKIAQSTSSNYRSLKGASSRSRATSSPKPKPPFK